jgi:hypothetical protein
MRIAIAVLVSAAACSGGAAHEPIQGHPVGAVPILHGTVQTQAAGWCGGARPPEEYKPPAPVPAPNAPVLVRKGGENSDSDPVASLTTDANGAFQAALTEGTYCLILADKKDRPQPGPNTDAACLEQYWKQCDAVVTLPQAKPVEITHAATCFGPCYRGPLPP